jgi:hypothetical protein
MVKTEKTAFPDALRLRFLRSHTIMLDRRAGMRMNQPALKFFLLVQLAIYALNAQGLGAAFGAELDQSQTERPAYKNGESWTFSARSKRHDGSSSTKLLDGEFEITFQKGRRRIFRIDGNTKLEESAPGALTLMLPTAGIIKHISQYFEFPLAVGKTWKTKYFSEVYRQWISPEASVTGIETVTTPAGVFSAYRIERTFSYSRTYSNEGFGVRIKQIYFYSPETRTVVKYNYQLEYQSTGDPILSHTTEIELARIGIQR